MTEDNINRARKDMRNIIMEMRNINSRKNFLTFLKPNEQ